MPGLYLENVLLSLQAASFRSIYASLAVIHFPLHHRIRNRLRSTFARDVLVAYRHRGLLPEDVILSSFPKSGTTWLTFMLAHLLWQSGREQTLVDDRFLPRLGYQNRAEKKLPSGGRLIRSHEPYRAAYRKAIYVVRDGRDAAVSMYWHSKRVMGMVADFSDYLPLFLEGRLTGAGSWSTHVEGWLNSPPYAAGNVLVARYEDMKSQPVEVLQKAGAFLSIDASDAAIADAIDAGSLDSMKERERKTKGLAHKETGEKIPVVRKGVVGDWRNYFTEADEREFMRVAGGAMARLGYATSNKT